RFRSTSATATRRRCLLAVSERMSSRAMPAAPKLACRRVSFGAAWACSRSTNGPVRPAAAGRFRGARRVGRGVVMGMAPWGGVGRGRDSVGRGDEDAELRGSFEQVAELLEQGGDVGRLQVGLQAGEVLPALVEQVARRGLRVAVEVVGQAALLL